MCVSGVHSNFSSLCSRLSELLSFKGVWCSSSFVSNEEGRVVCKYGNPFLKFFMESGKTLSFFVGEASEGFL